MELMGYPEGRQATRAQLRTRLATAPVRYIEGALENPEAGVEEVCLVLRNRLATPEQIRRITRDRRFSDADAVRLGVLRHPNTPLSLARSLLGRLRPRELTDLTEDASLSPGLRHSAGQVLEQCCEELTLGERISLARRAPDGIVEALGRTGDAPVLIALLSNPRVREEHVERIAGSDKAPAEALRRLAEHPTWGRRPTVRCALLRNPHTPVPVAVRLVLSMPEEEMAILARDPKTPRIVKVCAIRRLEGNLAPLPRRPDAG